MALAYSGTVGTCQALTLTLSFFFLQGMSVWQGLAETDGMHGLAGEWKIILNLFSLYWLYIKMCYIFNK